MSDRYSKSEHDMRSMSFNDVDLLRDDILESGFKAWKDQIVDRLSEESNFERSALKVAFDSRLEDEDDPDDAAYFFIEQVLSNELDLIPGVSTRMKDRIRIALNVLELVVDRQAQCATVCGLVNTILDKESTYDQIATAASQVAKLMDEPVEGLSASVEDVIDRLLGDGYESELVSCYCRADFYPKFPCGITYTKTFDDGKAMRVIFNVFWSSSHDDWKIGFIELADDLKSLSSCTEKLAIKPSNLPASEKRKYVLKDAISKLGLPHAYAESIKLVLSCKYAANLMNKTSDSIVRWDLDERDKRANEQGEDGTFSSATADYESFRITYRFYCDKAYEELSASAKDGKTFLRVRHHTGDDGSIWRRAISSSPRSEASKLNQPEKVELSLAMGDVIVRSRLGRCSPQQHHLMPVTGLIGIISITGRYKQVKCNLRYCQECKSYFMRENEYDRLRSKGIICCSVIEERHTARPSTGYAANWNDESIIHRYGYNVNAAEGLSAEDRRAILTLIIEGNIQTREQIIDFLQMQVDQRSGMKNMEAAISKWKSDIAFLDRYQAPRWAIEIRSILRK